MNELAKDTAGRATEILDAAERLLTHFGYRRTVMDDVAREAGVAKGTLYLYFAGKAELFRAIQTRSVADGFRRCDMVDASKVSLDDRLYDYLDAWFGALHERFGTSDYLSELSSARSSVSADIAKEADAVYRDRLAAVFAAAVRSGVADLTRTGMNPGDLASAMIWSARGAKYVAGKPVDLETYRASLRTIASVHAAAAHVWCNGGPPTDS